VLNLKSESGLVDLIQAAHPGAATPLHDRFAAGLRVLLRHRIPNADLETGVFFVLVTVARAVREGNIMDDDCLLSEVRAAANSFIDGSVIPENCATQVAIEEIRRVIRQFSSKEQEILFRFYNLRETEDQISQEMELTVETVRKVKKNARQRVLGKK
jgi:hypothetical protein